MKTVLVTGGARRIGAAIVKTLHQAGFAVAIHCRDSHEQAFEFAHRLNRQKDGSCAVFQAELTDNSQRTQLIEQVVAWKPQLVGLINNASVFHATKLGSFDDDAWDKLFNVNLKACFHLSELAYPHLAQHGGVIINIGDIHAGKPLRNHAVYCMTKAALNMQTKALAIEYAPRVRVNAIAPGAIAWPEGENALSEQGKQKIVAKTPLGCHGNPDCIAQAVSSLIDNDFITGQILAVDGGRSLK